VWNATIPYQGLEIAAAIGEVVLAFRLARRFGSGRLEILHAAWILAAIAAVLAPPAYLIFLATDRWVSPVYAHVGTQFWAFSVVFPVATIARSIRAPRTKGSAALIAAALGCLALAADMLAIEPNRLEESELRVALPAWRGGEVRIAHVSDLQTTGFGEREARALDAVRRMHADFVVFTGDYVSKGLGSGPQIEAARRFLAGIDAPLGVFAVAGDSEEEEDRERIFAGLSNVQYLRNESRTIEVAGAPLAIVGLQRFKFDVEAGFRDVPPGVPTIVVHHDPDIVQELGDRRVDLLVAGHTHGGQICLPWLGPPVPRTQLGRDRASGFFEVNGVLVHVSRGIGLSGKFAPRVRFLCPPEVTLLHVVSGSPP
jgi:uncharacterized protein